ncbi:MAG: hypothetical protein A2V79_07825 [Betaproteobacteria bacterium RBG_16_56_24]|nr:MAG: hypothetical protein A2V79_07825 [Betaproteobacteria bacterium RBG_16_56_24]
MFKLNEVHQSVLKSYSRPIVHMRKQVESNRFGLIFGAGLSQGCHIPTWGKLVTALAKDPEVDGENVLNVIPPRAGLPYQTEMLFEHFKHRRYSGATTEKHNTRALDFRIGADWRELIRNHLYKNIPDNLGNSLDSHPYLKQFLPIIRRSYMTVTYNFDDFLEQSLLKDRGKENTDSRGFESVTNPWTQFRRTNTVIYHPNGVVPQNLLEMPSDRFVFSEASYAKQLMGVFAGDQAGLVSHLSKHTCLLIGLSLEDDTLRNVLMQGAHSCPGNFHYYVHYLKPGEMLDENTKRAIRLANFKVYNLVTLFMHDEEICALGEMLDTINCPPIEFRDFAEQHNIQVKFRFYFTGVMGVGKSTAINYFRNLEVLDEWLEQRLPILAKSWENLTADEKQIADDWIIDQFKRKNDKLRNLHEGIIVLDRGPLDPITFTPDTEWGDKAARLLRELCPGQAQWQVEDGRVVILEGEGSELALRLLLSQRKDYTAEKLQSMERLLEKVYGIEGVTRLDTRGLTPSDVARRVAEIVHLEPYVQTCNLHKRLEDIKKDGFNVAS